MAKTASKAAKAPAKTAVKKSKPKAPAKASIEKICEDTLKTLKSLSIEPQLQSDITWCLGSYKSDKNPVGLYEMAGRALAVLQAEKVKKTKGVTTKLIDDLEKAIKSR